MEVLGGEESADDDFRDARSVHQIHEMKAGSSKLRGFVSPIWYGVIQ